MPRNVKIASGPAKANIPLLRFPPAIAQHSGARSILRLRSKNLEPANCRRSSCVAFFQSITPILSGDSSILRPLSGSPKVYAQCRLGLHSRGNSRLRLFLPILAYFPDRNGLLVCRCCWGCCL
ncbi:unnamed protein product [Linum trigynum]|uniref:Uncharacterized protein n=1 Tax=Linum trigynum TaxID=586398 RepID=A0AAV2F019_9ROSI